MIVLPKGTEAKNRSKKAVKSFLSKASFKMELPEQNFIDAYAREDEGLDAREDFMNCENRNYFELFNLPSPSLLPSSSPLSSLLSSSPPPPSPP